MAYTITRSDVREITVVAGASDVTVVITKAKSDYTLESFVASTTITAGNTQAFYYDEDGIYVITATESAVTTKYIDLCVEDAYDHIETDILAILENEVDECDYSGKRYDFVALLLLGLQFFGNTTYELYVDATSWTTLPTALQLIEDAIVRSATYMELNDETTQSEN